MSIDVTARHMKVRQDVSDHAWDVAGNLLEQFPNIEHIHVILDVQKRNKTAEIVVQGKSHLKVEGKESTENLITAIDVSAERVERQLRKMRDQKVAHR